MASAPQPPCEDTVDLIQAQWRRERPDTDVSSTAVVSRLLQAAKLLSDDQRRHLGPSGLDSSTRDLLSTLRRAGPPYRLSAGELARRSLLSTGAMSQRLSRAEGQGMVRRRRDPSDGRAVVVEPTPEGHALLERTLDPLLERERYLLEGLDERQQRRLADLLRRLILDLTDKAGSGSPAGVDRPGEET